MKKIPLSRGYEAIVDDEDYEDLMQCKWHVRSDHRTHYAVRSQRISRGRFLPETMHRYILGLERGDKTQVDHINHNGLDNRRKNLRACSHNQNVQNSRVRRDSRCGFKGVNERRPGRWRALIRVNGRRITIGNFRCPREAAIAYDGAALKYFGDFALLNFPKSSRLNFRRMICQT